MANFISSFSIINAAALIGLLSLVIPIIIHLINRSKGKLVYLGNIELVKQVKRIRVTEVKLSQWLLLLLRLLIFTLITLLVAGLNQKSNLQTVNQTQLYFSPQWILTQGRSSFREILKQHPEAKSFVLIKDFPEIIDDNFDQLKQQLGFNNTKLQSSAFVTEIANRQQQAKQIIIFSSNASSEFSEYQPQRYKNIEWRFPSSDNKSSSASEILVDIYSDKTRIFETRLLQIAFEYLASKGNQKYRLVYHTINQSSKTLAEEYHQGWILWLTDVDVTEGIWSDINQGSYLLTDYVSKNTQNPIPSRTVTNAIIAGVDSEFVGLNEHHEAEDLTHEVIWSDNLHTEILTSKTMGSGVHYKFYSRFNPAWNNLVENTNFPSVLSNLLSSPYSHNKNRSLAISELDSLPLVTSDKRFSKDLHHCLILIIALFWLIERWLSEKQKAS